MITNHRSWVMAQLDSTISHSKMLLPIIVGSNNNFFSFQSTYILKGRE